MFIFEYKTVTSILIDDQWKLGWMFTDYNDQLSDQLS